MPDDRPLTMVAIVSSDSIQPGATAHTRSWEVPAAAADLLAAKLATMYGDPAEGLCPVGSMTDLATVKGHLFISGGEGDTPDG